jgi:flagellar protein FliJ
VTRRFRLASVLRARQAQETAARAAVARARTDAAIAVERHERRRRALTEQPMLAAGTASCYAAALSARQAMAAELSAAAELAAAAGHMVDERMTELTDAAVRRRSVESLAERHAAAPRQAEEHASQLAVDEVAATRWGSAAEGDR